MILDLRKIFLNDGESMPVKCEFDFSNVDFFGGYPLKQPVKVSGIIENRAGVVGVELDCEAFYTAPCDRCAKESTAHHQIKVQKVLVTERFSGDDEDLILLENYKFDIEDLCYTEVISSLPMKHLCKQDCKGVCQKCGKDLNEGDCDCESDNIDPRLEKLRELLKQ